MLRPHISTLVTRWLASLLAISIGVGLGAVTSIPANGAVPRPGGDFDTDLTLVVPRCEDCVITLFSSDGRAPIYASDPATVTDGRVTITLPSERTAGMSVRVAAPWAQSTKDTFVAWRYTGSEIGDKVKFKDARSRTSASGCWAGTVNAAVTLKVKVRRVRHRGRPTAMAWAPVTESFVEPVKRVRRGVLTSGNALTCDLD